MNERARFFPGGSAGDPPASWAGRVLAGVRVPALSPSAGSPGLRAAVELRSHRPVLGDQTRDLRRGLWVEHRFTSRGNRLQPHVGTEDTRSAPASARLSVPSHVSKGTAASAGTQEPAQPGREPSSTHGAGFPLLVPMLCFAPVLRPLPRGSLPASRAASSPRPRGLSL